MLIKRGGIFKTVDSKDFGFYQQMGFEKVINEPLKKIEEVKVEIEVEPKSGTEPKLEREPEPIKEVAKEQPIKEIEVEPEKVIEEKFEKPKSKRKRNNN